MLEYVKFRTPDGIEHKLTRAEIAAESDINYLQLWRSQMNTALEEARISAKAFGIARCDNKSLATKLSMLEMLRKWIENRMGELGHPVENFDSEVKRLKRLIFNLEGTLMRQEELIRELKGE